MAEKTPKSQNPMKFDERAINNNRPPKSKGSEFLGAQERFTVLLQANLAKELDDYSKEMGISKGAVARIAIKQFLNKD